MGKIISLDKEFKSCCEPNYNNYTVLDENKIIVHNFFKYFEKSQTFFKNRDKWETNIFDGDLKPGIESIFPKWFVQVFLEKYFKDNNLIVDINSFKASTIYFYNGAKKYYNLSSDCSLPHIDKIESPDGFLNYVCLINLNDFPVTTQFWKYKDKLSCESEIENVEYIEYVIDKSKKYYKLNDLKKIDFLNNDIVDLKVVEEVTYSPNDALIYPVNLYHSPKLEKFYTKSNPRVLLRLSYEGKKNL